MNVLMLMRTGYVFLLVFLVFFTAIDVRAGTAAFSYYQQSLVVEGETYQVRIPKGYKLELLTNEMEAPRLLSFLSNGDLFAGSGSDNVYRIPPPYNNPQVLIKLDDYPHSVAFRSDKILIARTSGLYQAPYKPGQKKLSNRAVKLLAALPGGGGHNSRTVKVGPDGKIYLGLGISGNCSNQYLGNKYSFKDRRGGVLVLNEKNKKPEWLTFASGLRNPVGFDWHPGTRVMYASNNGPDHRGFEQPPEYFSRLTRGSFHGMPWYQYDGKKIQRDDCITKPAPKSIKSVVAPVLTFPARNAPMAVAFVPTSAMDKRFQHDAIVALRGSWGTRPSGSYFGDPASRRSPKLVIVRFKNGVAIRVDDLVTGFQLKDGSRWARPVGVATGPDGAVYFTSDSGINGLFRLRRIKNSQ